MKKFVLFLIGTAIWAVAEAGSIQLDNRFLSDGKGLVRGWTYNSYKSFQPAGKVLPVMHDGKSGVRLVSGGADTAVFHQREFPAQTGECYRFSFLGAGHGTYVAGFYLYRKGMKWGGKSIKKGNLNSETPAVIQFEVIIDSADISFMRPVLGTIGKNADVRIYGLKIEKVKK